MPFIRGLNSPAHIDIRVTSTDCDSMSLQTATGLCGLGPPALNRPPANTCVAANERE